MLVLVQLDAGQPWWGRRFVPGSANDPAAERQPCPEVTTLSEANRLGCLSKYDCAQVCEQKKKCRTQYEYKCTDFKRRECKEVWQNQCNGLNSKKKNVRGRRAIRTGSAGSAPSGRNFPADGSASSGRSLRGEEGGGDFSGRRAPRLIPTEVVYDQSYPLPNNGLPFADPVVGRSITFIISTYKCLLV